MQTTKHAVAGFSADTEILTRDGWKSFPQLGDADQVATRSPDGWFEWHQLNTRQSYPFRGELVEFTNKTISLAVAPGHPMLVRRRLLARQARAGIRTRWHEWHVRHAGYFGEHPGAVFEFTAGSRWTGSAPAEFVIPGQEADRPHRAHEEATKWLASYLTRDWTPSADVIGAYKAAGISEHAYIAARENLGIQKRRCGSTRSGKGVSWWELSAPTRQHVPGSGPYRSLRELRIPMKAFCAFLGLFIAEGWVRYDRDEIQVAQFETSRHLPEIWQILNATGLKWNYLSSNKRFYTSHKGLAAWLRANTGRLAPGKRIPEGFLDFPPDHLELLSRGGMIGDGHWGPCQQRYYTTTSPLLADQVQELFQKIGVNAWIRPQDPVAGTMMKRRSYVVRERLRDVHILPSATLLPYDGQVYSVTVPNGIVYVRRLGRAMWSSAGHANMLEFARPR